MWIIAGNGLMSLPKDAPLPPGAKPVELPGDFRAEPRRYMVRDGALVERPDFRAPPAREKRVAPLTDAEILALRALLANVAPGSAPE